MKDYYKILEVEENATEEEIKKKYRNLSKKYHPDVNPDGDDKFKEINEAYEHLGDKTKRAEYDNRKNNPMGGSPFDIFGSMFGGGGFQQQRRKNAPDKIIKVEISPIESYHGLQKNISYFRDIKCHICDGSGGDQQQCQTCRGAGFQIKTFGTGFMVQQIRTVCSTCGGRGYTLIHKCYYCDGRGAKQATNEITISIPKGSDSGQFFKIPSAGDYKNSDVGDLILQVELIPKDGYEKMNSDLIYNLYLNLQEIQKDKFNIPHPDGELIVNSPKVFDSSKPLRLRGKGYPGGDMYVKLNVRFERSI
jgi:molecular chaperone DnaJ